MNEYDGLLSELKDVLSDLAGETSRKKLEQHIIEPEAPAPAPSVSVAVEEKIEEEIPHFNTIFFHTPGRDVVDDFIAKLLEQVKTTAKKQFGIRVIKKYEFVKEEDLISKVDEIKNLNPHVVFTFYDFLESLDKFEMMLFSSNIHHFGINTLELSKKATYMNLVIELGLILSKI